jgi:hypothetical protein
MSYIWAGLALGLTGAAVVLAFRLPLGTTDLLGIATLVGASLLNGFIAATLTIVLQLAVSSVLGLTTAVQLQELSRPDHPLLQFVLRNAPGTYQHSLQISNLAEQAAERIGANTLLTRVGSLYHTTTYLHWTALKLLFAMLPTDWNWRTNIDFHDAFEILLLNITAI